MERWQAKLLALVGCFFLPLLCTLLPHKLSGLVARMNPTGGTSILSYLMCFGGGIFFGTYLLHMGPEVRKLLKESLLDPYHIDYPLADLFVGIGFLLVLFAEKLVLRWNKRRLERRLKRIQHAPPVTTLVRGRGSRVYISQFDAEKTVAQNSGQSEHSERPKYEKSISVDGQLKSQPLNGSVPVSQERRHSDKSIPTVGSDKIKKINEVADEGLKAVVDGVVLRHGSNRLRESQKQKAVGKRNGDVDANRNDVSWDKNGVSLSDIGLREIVVDDKDAPDSPTAQPIGEHGGDKKGNPNHSHGGHDEGGGHHHHSTRSIILILALSLHRIFEGMSIGLQQSLQNTWSLFLAVMCHETVIGFSLGLQFVKANLQLRRLLVTSLVCSSIMPLGVATGIVMTETGGEDKSIAIANGILQAIAMGTFIYVTFFEILQEEVDPDDTSLGKIVCIAAGFGLMALLNLIPEEQDSGISTLLNDTTAS